MARTQYQKIEHMGRVPLFSQLSQRQLQRLSRHVDEVTISAGRVMAREGHIGQELFVIVEGKAKVERRGKVIALLGPGDFFGEMSLLDHKPRSATVTAETDVTALVIHVKTFRPVLDDTPGMKDKILLGLVERLRRADESLIG